MLVHACTPVCMSACACMQVVASLQGLGEVGGARVVVLRGNECSLKVCKGKYKLNIRKKKFNSPC